MSTLLEDLFLDDDDGFSSDGSDGEADGKMKAPGAAATTTSVSVVQQAPPSTAVAVTASQPVAKRRQLLPSAPTVSASSSDTSDDNASNKLRPASGHRPPAATVGIRRRATQKMVDGSSGSDDTNDGNKAHRRSLVPAMAARRDVLVSDAVSAEGIHGGRATAARALQREALAAALAVSSDDDEDRPPQRAATSVAGSSSLRTGATPSGVVARTHVHFKSTSSRTEEVVSATSATVHTSHTVQSPPVAAAVQSPPVAAAVQSPPVPPVAAAVQSPPVAAAVQSPPVAAVVQSPPVAAAAQSPPVAAAVQSPPVAAAAQSPVATKNPSKSQGLSSADHQHRLPASYMNQRELHAVVASLEDEELVESIEAANQRYAERLSSATAKNNSNSNNNTPSALRVSNPRATPRSASAVDEDGTVSYQFTDDEANTMGGSPAPAAHAVAPVAVRQAMAPRQGSEMSARENMSTGDDEEMRTSSSSVVFFDGMSSARVSQSGAGAVGHRDARGSSLGTGDGMSDISFHELHTTGETRHLASRGSAAAAGGPAQQGTIKAPDEEHRTATPVDTSIDFNAMDATMSTTLSSTSPPRLHAAAAPPQQKIAAPLMSSRSHGGPKLRAESSPLPTANTAVPQPHATSAGNRINQREQKRDSATIISPRGSALKPRGEAGPTERSGTAAVQRRSISATDESHEAALRRMHDRGVYQKERREASYAEERRRREAAALKACTFAPTITSARSASNGGQRRSESAQPPPGRPPRAPKSHSEKPPSFYESNSVRRTRRLHEEKRILELANKDHTECTFTPAIEPVSAALIERARSAAAAAADSSDTGVDGALDKKKSNSALPAGERLYRDSARRAVELLSNADNHLQLLRGGTAPQVKRTADEIARHVHKLQSFQSKREASILRLMQEEEQRIKANSSGNDTFVDPDAVVQRLLHRNQSYGRKSRAPTTASDILSAPQVNAVSKELAQRRKRAVYERWFAALGAAQSTAAAESQRDGERSESYPPDISSMSHDTDTPCLDSMPGSEPRALSRLWLAEVLAVHTETGPSSNIKTTSSGVQLLLHADDCLSLIAALLQQLSEGCGLGRPEDASVHMNDSRGRDDVSLPSFISALAQYEHLYGPQEWGWRTPSESIQLTLRSKQQQLRSLSAKALPQSEALRMYTRLHQHTTYSTLLKRQEPIAASAERSASAAAKPRFRSASAPPVPQEKSHLQRLLQAHKEELKFVALHSSSNSDAALLGIESSSGSCHDAVDVHSHERARCLASPGRQGQQSDHSAPRQGGYVQEREIDDVLVLLERAIASATVAETSGVYAEPSPHRKPNEWTATPSAPLDEVPIDVTHVLDLSDTPECSTAAEGPIVSDITSQSSAVVSGAAATRSTHAAKPVNSSGANASAVAVSGKAPAGRHTDPARSNLCADTSVSDELLLRCAHASSLTQRVISSRDRRAELERERKRQLRDLGRRMAVAQLQVGTNGH